MANMSFILFRKKIIDESLINEINKYFDYEDNVEKDIYLVYFLAKKYYNYLKSKNIKKAIVICYYRPEAFSFTLAANRLGIETYEYQHGEQNDYHFMYTNWENVPTEGYNIIPKHFLMWGDIPAASIKKWIKNNNYFKVSTIGNTWLAYNRKSNQEKINIDNNKPIILFSLQGDVTINDTIINVIKNTNDKYNWILRPHPNQSHSQENIKILNQLSIISLDEASKINLYSLLNKIDLHITGFSTVAFEAQSLEVPTIFTHENALNGFSELLGKNGLYYSNNINQTILLMDKMITNKPKITPDYIISDKEKINSQIQHLINL